MVRTVLVHLLIASPSHPLIFPCTTRGPILALREHRLHLVHEVADVLKLPVDRGKTDVGDLIELFQVLHRQFAEDRPRDFLAKVAGVNVGFDFADDRFDLLVADWAFVASLFEATAELGRVERLAGLVLLDDLERALLDLLDGRNAALAVAADPPTTGGEAAGLAAGINDGEIAFTAKGTFHGDYPVPHRGSGQVLPSAAICAGYLTTVC